MVVRVGLGTDLDVWFVCKRSMRGLGLIRMELTHNMRYILGFLIYLMDYCILSTKASVLSIYVRSIISWYEPFDLREEELDGGVMVSLLSNLRVRLDIQKNGKHPSCASNEAHEQARDRWR